MKPQFKLTIAVMAIILFCTNTIFAQNVVYDMNGRGYKPKSYSEIEGDPYLLKDWSKGVVKFANNTIINGIDLKFDQIDGVLLYKDAKGETMEVADPVLEFKIGEPLPGFTMQRLFRTGFKPVGNNTEKTFYEVLSDGNVKFIKRAFKTIIEEKEYNSPTNVKKIVEKVNYYVVKTDGTLIPVSKNEKAILAAIGDKNTELTAYIKANKLNLKNDADILKVFEYYFGISKA